MNLREDHRKDYYTVLGLAPAASNDQIRDSYRRLAKQFHPDVASPDRKPTERFRDINEAYAILGNPVRRKDYDQDRAADQARGSRIKESEPSSSHKASPSEPVEIERPGWWDEGRNHSGRVDAGECYEGRGSGADVLYGDIQTELLVTLNEVLTGASRVINLPRKELSETPRQFTLEVPRGVRPGHVIRLRGRGRTSLSRGTRGDLFVSVGYAAHPDFKVNGVDLHGHVLLHPWQFVLGDVVRVPSIEGSLSARIPQGSVPGQSLRLHQYGLPDGNNHRGDLVFELGLEFPRQLTVQERRAWEAVRQASQSAR